MTKSEPRVPHAERPEVIAEFCTCVAAFWRNQEDLPHALPKTALYNRNPKCVLHGENAQPAPF